MISALDSLQLSAPTPEANLNPYYNFDFWVKAAQNPPEQIELTVFLPNGILLLLTTNYTSTLSEIKEVSSTEVIDLSAAFALNLNVGEQFYY